MIPQYPLSVREGIGSIAQAVQIGIMTSEEIKPKSKAARENLWRRKAEAAV